MKYTIEQEKAIKCVDKDLAISAGAGAGKTRVLVDRIVYIIEKGYANLEEIVAITYTNKAAIEIKQRLRNSIKEKDKLGICYISTIHSFCFRLLQENPVQADIDPGVIVIEEYRASALLRKSIEKTVVSNIESDDLFSLVEEIGYEKLIKEIYINLEKMRNQGFPLEKLKEKTQEPRERIILKLMDEALERFSSRKEAMGVLDFDDILQKTLYMLQNFPEILEYYQEKFKYIMVDEYQDLNYVQDAILRLLGKKNNLFVVGDKKQSIYGFRGARVELFEKLFKDLEAKGQSIELRDNFRSEKNIIEYINMKFKDLMKDYKPINPNRPEGKFTNISYLIVDDDGLVKERRAKEAVFIAKKIKKIVGNKNLNYDYKDISILLRKRTHLAQYTKALDDEGIPYYVAETGSLIESKQVRHILNALKAIEERDEISLYGTLTGLLNHDPFDIALMAIEKDGLSYFFEGGASVDSIVHQWMNIKDTSTIYELVNRIIDDTDLMFTSSEEELENLFLFKTIVKEYDEQGYVLKDFLGEIEGFGDEQQEASLTGEEDNVVKFITIHSSKGLEFPIVILADSNSDIKTRTSNILFDPDKGITLKENKEKWADIKKTIEQKEMEESKRLLYVAMTRAEDYLIIAGDSKSGKKPSFLRWLMPKGDEKGYYSIECLDIMEADDNVLLPQKENIEIYRDIPENIFSDKGFKIPQVFSTTLLGQYLNCPRKYYYKHVVQIPEISKGEEVKSSTLSGVIRGTIVHKIIEYAEGSGRGRLEYMISMIPENLDSEARDYIEDCLKNYNESLASNITGQRYLELPFLWNIAPYQFISGKIDCMIIKDNTAVIMDFKTNRSISQDLMKAYKLQLLCYTLAMEDILNITVEKAVIASLYEGVDYELEFGKPKKEYKKDIRNLILEIAKNTATKEYSMIGGCKYCGYKEVLCCGK